MTPRAFAALCFLALAGCVDRVETDSDEPRPAALHAHFCVARCEKQGMRMAGAFAGSSEGCICAADIPNCDAAWSRADAAADVALACNQTLAECVRRGGAK